jgi:hypothetical protein
MNHKTIYELRESIVDKIEQDAGVVTTGRNGRFIRK